MTDDNSTGSLLEKERQYLKWKKAVVHIEPARSSKSYTEMKKIHEEVVNDLESGHLTQEEAQKRMHESISRDVRFQGTAIFLHHNSLRYLVTARHVVHDEKSHISDYLDVLPGDDHAAKEYRERLLAYDNEYAEKAIFNMIFLVPSLDDALRGINPGIRDFLMNLGAGPYDLGPYVFSSPTVDLAVISLDQRDSSFADSLMSRGYRPVALADIADGPASETGDVFSVGYPGSVSVIGKRMNDPAMADWSSNSFSLPVFSYGRVSMTHDKLPFFWCDLSCYPGSSGSPIIENGKLIGVVSEQAGQPEPILNESGGQGEARYSLTRIPFAKATKGKFVRDLLLEQEKKTRMKF